MESHWAATPKWRQCLRRCFFLLVFVGSAWSDAPPAAPAAPPASDQPYHFSTSVQMVTLQATVLTPKGALVKGLRQSNFHVYEDRQPQNIRLFRHDDSPVAVGLLVDHSGSMRRKHAAILAAAKTFAKSSNPKDELFVINFDEKVHLGLTRMQLFSSNARELERALPTTAGGGKTALYDALEAGLHHVRELKQDKKALILISDGGDNASIHTLDQVIADVKSSDVVIYTIGLFGLYEEETNPAFLQQLAETTGGEVFLPKRANQAASQCKRIAQTIRNQYTLGYAPNQMSASAPFRTVQVSVTAPRRGKLLARTRLGYVPQPNSSAMPPAQ
jgi:Ca-activated chloride channel homolog